MRRLFLIALSLGVSACVTEGGGAIAPCFDEARGIVQMKRAAQCSGRIVSADEAAALRAEDAAERRASMARNLREDARLKRAGLRLASAGTGFAVSKSGELLTSAHVVAGCHALEARGGAFARPVPAKVMAQDSREDLAVLRIKARTPDHARFAPARPLNAAPLALIGYPKEGLFRLEPRLTPVTASYALSDPTKTGALGLRGDVRQGNSGGPVLDSRGRVVGVLRATVDTVRAHRENGVLLKNLAELVDARPTARFLERARTRYVIDGAQGREKSGRALFEDARRYVYRIDCLKRV